MNNCQPLVKSYKDKIALSVLIFAVLAGCFIYFIILPTIEKIKKINIETTAQSAQIKKDYSDVKKLKKIAENLKIITPKLSELNQAFINEKDSLAFITTLEETAEKNSVTEKASLGTESNFKNTYSLIPLRLETKGYFADQINFLSSLESLNYYLNINTLELSAANSSQTANGETKKNVIMQILADTYWQE